MMSLRRLAHILESWAVSSSKSILAIFESLSFSSSMNLRKLAHISESLPFSSSMNLLKETPISESFVTSLRKVAQISASWTKSSSLSFRKVASISTSFSVLSSSSSADCMEQYTNNARMPTPTTQTAKTVDIRPEVAPVHSPHSFRPVRPQLVEQTVHRLPSYPGTQIGIGGNIEVVDASSNSLRDEGSRPTFVVEDVNGQLEFTKSAPGPHPRFSHLI
mmetsp:Transcript_7851/g.12562  ORF Transcript_7851/g.12562 Transcript_7851/m.12562 type:complete len:219 (-) Transcript_7851:3572-4228(-)